MLFYVLYLIVSLVGNQSLAATFISNTNIENVSEKFIPASNAQLFCRIVGKGKPLIVIHGGPGLTQDYLLPQLYKLAENNLVVFYDQRGCGKSTGDINPETMTMESFVNDLEIIRKAFNFEKVSILGHSWGGFVAMNYSITYPDNIDKLILSNSMPVNSDGLNLFIQEWMKRTAPHHAELDEIHNTEGFCNGDPDITERLHRLIFRTYCFIPEKADLLSLRMTAMASLNGAKVYENISKNVFEKPFDLSSSLKKLKVKTLVLHGDADPVPAITAQKTHECIPNSKYILMHKCGHFPYVEDPNNYFRFINDFLK